MDKLTAIKIIESLAEGVEPFSDQEFPPGSSMQNVKVVRSLYFALSIIKKHKTKNHTTETKNSGSEHDTYDLLINRAKSEKEEIWREYCSIVMNEDPYHFPEQSENYENDIEIIEVEFSDNNNQNDNEYRNEYKNSDSLNDEDLYDKDYEDALNKILKEIYKNMDTYSPS